MRIQIEVFWIVTPYGAMVGYQHFWGLCCLHLQGEMNERTPGIYICPPSSVIYITLKMEAARSSETLVSYHITTRCWLQPFCRMSLTSSTPRFSDEAASEFGFKAFPWSSNCLTVRINHSSSLHYSYDVILCPATDLRGISSVSSLLTCFSANVQHTDPYKSIGMPVNIRL